VPCEKQESLLPLVCWQSLEDDNKGASAEIPEPVAATPRRADSTTLDLQISMYCHHRHCCGHHREQNT